MNYDLFKYKKPHKSKRARDTVSEKTYIEVYNLTKGHCALCHSIDTLEYHHIYYRSERKDLIDNANNGIMLCKKCHDMCHENKHFWQAKLLKLREEINHE